MSRGAFRTRPSLAYGLSVGAAAAAAASALAGALAPAVYRDNAFTVATWSGSDRVTLVAVPALVVALVLASRGSARAQLVWLGLVDYVLYNAAFYVFGAALNELFLLNVSAMALSGLTLLFALTKLDTGELASRTSPRLPRRMLAGYCLFVALGLGAVEIGQVVAFAVSGERPDVLVNTGHPTHIVAALDMTMVIPFLVLAAVWLLRRDAWGVVVATIVNVKGAAYMAALTAASIAAAREGFGDASAQIPIWAVLGVTSLVASVLLVGGVRAGPKPDGTHATPSHADAPR